MAMKFVSSLSIFALIVGTAFTFGNTAKASTLPSLYINPPETTGLNIGDMFNISINIGNITNLAGWQVELFYSTSVIIAIQAQEGPFLKSAPANTLWVATPVQNDYNSTHGHLLIGCVTLPAVGVNGSGTLATVTFQTVGAGSSIIAISRDPEMTKLLDNTFPPPPQKIPHDTVDGSVSLTANDIAVTGIHISKTFVNDTEVRINVTVANLGNYSASFNTTLYYDSTEIGTQTVTDLAASSSLILTFVWNTSTVSKGNYTISAYAHPIIGEDYTANNQLVGGWVVETILGDLNGDGKVNIIDVTLVATAFQTRPGDPKWNPNADLDNNGLINIVDITKVAKEFGKVDP